MLRFGNVNAVYALNGYPVCDLVDEITGSVFTGCRFTCSGGGSMESVHYTPPAVGARVIYGQISGPNQSAVVLGSVYATKALRRLTADPPVDLESDEDYPPQVGVNDTYMEKGNAWFFLTDEGEFVFDCSQVAKPFRIQLGVGGSSNLRISQDGEANERVLLSGPAMEYMDTLRSDLDDVRGKLADLIVELNGVNLATGQASNVASLQIPGLETGIDMVASAIQISSRSIENDEI